MMLLSAGSGRRQAFRRWQPLGSSSPSEPFLASDPRTHVLRLGASQVWLLLNGQTGRPQLKQKLHRVLVGLDEYVVLDAVEVDDELVVTVAVPRPEAPCPRCGCSAPG